MRFVFVSILACACGAAQSDTSTSATTPHGDWHPSTTSDASMLRIRLDGSKPWCADVTAILGDMCADAMLVWGDLNVDESVRARAVEIALGDGKPALSGFLICQAYAEPFLKLQTLNPRIKAGHGGTADLKWRGGQWFMRRRWSAADIALGQLAPPPSDVFQKGEALAALVSIEDHDPVAADLIASLANVPQAFVFGMFPLR